MVPNARNLHLYLIKEPTNACIKQQEIIFLASKIPEIQFTA